MSWNSCFDQFPTEDAEMPREFRFRDLIVNQRNQLNHMQKDNGDAVAAIFSLKKIKSVLS